MAMFKYPLGRPVLNKASLQHLMRDFTAIIVFKKRDNSTRVALASIAPSQISLAPQPLGIRERVVPDHQLPFIDLELTQWRSCIIDNIVSVHILNVPPHRTKTCQEAIIKSVARYHNKGISPSIRTIAKNFGLTNMDAYAMVVNIFPIKPNTCTGKGIITSNA
jgi:hypothetical protein